MKKILNQRSIIAMSAAALAFVLGGFIWALAELGSRGLQGGGPLILHFNDIVGITEIGMRGTFAFAGIFAAFAVVINFMIALELDARDRVLGKMIAALTLAAAVLLFIGCAAIINVNV
jgi:hypothetical protein